MKRRLGRDPRVRIALPLVILLAGCAGAPAGDAQPDAPASLPPPFEDAREVVGSGDVLVLAGEDLCATPSAQCVRYPFDLATDALVTAELTWTLAASDFDVYIFVGGEPSSLEGSNVAPDGATAARADQQLVPGAYEVVVVPAAVARDTYALRVTFAPPG